MEDNIKTNLDINTSDICSLCPYRLYAEDGQKIELGRGNITSDKLIVLPSGASKLILEILEKEYLTACGRNIFEDCYVTQICKCTNMAEYKISRSAISYCSRLLFYEISKIKPRVILFLGDSYTDYSRHFKVILAHNGLQKVIMGYHPAVMLYDNINNHNKFINDLVNFING